jgi:seryl-tRNA synthetase
MDNNGPRNRRVTVSELKRTKKSLTKQLRKERKRQEMISKLHKENEELYIQVTRVRDARNNTGECC